MTREHDAAMTVASGNDAAAIEGPHESGAFAPWRLLAVLLLWNAAWWAAIGLVAAPALPGGWLGVAGLALLSVAPTLVLARVISGALYPSALVRVLVLRPFWYVQLALPFVAAIGLLAALVALPFGAAAAAGRWTLAIAAATYVVLAIAGYAGSRALVVRRYEASFEALPQGLDGLRIVQLSDLHVGPQTPRRHLARIVAAVERLEPDMIAITGDQVDDHDLDVAHFARAFSRLRAPLGVFAVAGNHDVYAGWDGVRRGLEEMGIRVLVNDAELVERNGARFWIAGTGDPAGLHWRAEGGADAAPDVDRTLARVPDGAFTIALAHNPALWPALAARGVALTLSGHTHHGQLSVPALNWCLASPFLEHAMGPYAREGALLLINPGTNYWGIPLRLGAWPEVGCITLRRGAIGLRRVQ